MYKEHLHLINDLPALAEEKLAEIEKKEAALAPKEDEKPEGEPEQEKIDEPDEPAENTEPEVIQEEADEKEYCRKRDRFRRFFPAGCLCGNRCVP